MSCHLMIKRLSFLIEPDPQPTQATSSVNPLVPRDATDINTPVQGNV